MHWYAAVDMTGDLTDDDIMDIADDKPTSIEFNSNTRTGTIRLTINADTYDQAVRDALAAFGNLSTVRRLIADGALAQPHRFTVQDEKAEEQSLGILSTAGVAERLGVSAARVRQLKDVEPDFPQPLSIPGAAGDFYRTSEVDRYAASRKPGGAATMGKPRAGDEELLNDGLDALRYNTPAQLGADEVTILERARHTTGGRYVRGKAKVLVETVDRHGWQANPGTGSHRFLEALERAREIWRP